MTTHSGRPQLRVHGDGSGTVLCPLGHVVGGWRSGEFGGSWLEARASDPSWAVECVGTVPDGEAGQ